MGARVYYGLDVRRPEDLKDLVEFATEITKEWSLNNWGYDVTIHDEERDEHTGFLANDEGVAWYLYDGPLSRNGNMPVETFLNRVADRFPQMELLKWITQEGALVYEGIRENGEWGEVYQYKMYVYAETESDFWILADKLANKDCVRCHLVNEVRLIVKEHIVMLVFNQISGVEKDRVFASLTEEIGQLLPQIKPYSFIVQEEEGNYIIKKRTVIKNGAITWQDVTKEEEQNLYDNDLMWGDDLERPKAKYFKLLWRI